MSGRAARSRLLMGTSCMCIVVGKSANVTERNSIYLKRIRFSLEVFQNIKQLLNNSLLKQRLSACMCGHVHMCMHVFV